jgi:hypothetical protein
MVGIETDEESRDDPPAPEVDHAQQAVSIVAHVDPVAVRRASSDMGLSKATKGRPDEEGARVEK